MNITLNPEIEKFVEEKVRSGEFSSADEAVNELLTHIREQDQLSAEEAADLRSLVDVGIVELDRGEYAEFTASDIIAERRAAFAPRQKGV